MANRTVSVTLTGTAAPYSAAMRQAARTTAATATSIQTSMRTASAQSAAALTAMSRTAQVASARTTASVQTMATRSAASMAAMSSRSAAVSAAISAQWAAAAASVSRSMDSIRLAAATTGSHLVSTANNAEQSLEAARVASLGLVAAFGLAAAAAARFDKAMSEVRAVTGGAAGDMKQLEQAALEAGQATMYSATQAAQAEAELARAGISTADIVGGALKGSLDLAASGQLELGEAAIISAQAMNSFGLEGSDVAHVADVVSAGAGKSATNVHDLGQAFRQTALMSAQTGLSLEDTVGTLSLFAQNALTGSDAGTSLKVMLQRLVPQSNEAAATMDKLGFSAYDAQGNFIGLSALAGEMQTSFAQLTPEARNAAMATIFGSDAVRAATILYQAGTEGIDTWTAAVNDTGYATRVAATMTDNLSGDLERLKGALETALIQSGGAANEVLRTMAQVLTDVVNWYGQLNPTAQQSVTILAGMVGVVGLVGTSMLLLLPRIMAVRTELVALGVTAARTRALMMGLGRLGVVVAGLSAVSWSVRKLDEAFGEAPPNITKMTGSLTDLALEGEVAGEATRLFGEDLDEFGEAVARIAHPSTLDRVEDVFTALTFEAGGSALEDTRDKINAVDKALADLVASGSSDVAADAFDRLAEEAEASGTSTEKLKTLLPQYAEALMTADTQAKLAAGGQGELGDQVAMTAEEMQEQRTAAEKLTDALDALNGNNIDAAKSEISFRGSLTDLTAAVKENGHSLNVATAAGRGNKTAFLDAAEAAMDHAQAVAEQKDSVEAGNAVLEKDIKLLEATMRQAGFSEDAIRDLTSSYAQIPDSVETQIDAKTQGAIADLEAVRDKVRNTRGKTITMDAPTAEARRQLELLGFKVRGTKGKKVEITLPAGSPIRSAADIQAAIDDIHGKTVDVIVRRSQIDQGDWDANGVPDSIQRRANGGIIRRAADGMTVPGYAPRVDSVPALLSPGEGVLVPETVRALGGEPAITALNRWGRYGTPARFADGGVAGASYAPTQAAVLGGASEATQRYDDLTGQLKDAQREYRDAQKELERIRKGEHTKSELKDAQRKVADERADVYALDKKLGLPKGAGAPDSFNLKAYQKQLNESTAETEKWRKNLDKVGARGGQEVRDILEGMGEDGYELVNALAGANDKQFKDITSKLTKSAGVAKANLRDFQKQVDAATKTNDAFAEDLQTLAARGYGDLAQELAAQGDEHAMELAAQAASGSNATVAKINASVKASNDVLTGEDLTNSLVLLSTLRGGPGRGYAELIDAGLDTATISDLTPRMLDQINKLPEANKGTFLQQWAGQSGVVAMARGGILSGRAPVVLAGEARVPEAFIPLNGSSRSAALLAETARLSGYQLTPARRYGAGGGGTATVVREGDRINNITLNGAKQTRAEQVADIARRINFVG